MFLRKFIILNKQNSKDVKGHARLEVRGTKARLSLSLEGAKFKENIKYRAYFAMNEQNGFKEISLGIIDVNKSGRGKLDISFNPKSVNESKIDMNSFNILNIKEENIETMNEDIVLGGYIHKEDDSIAKLMNKISKTNKTNKVNQERSQSQKTIKESIKASLSTEKSKDNQEELKDKKENIEIKKQAKEEIKTEEKPKEKLKETPEKEKTEIKTEVKVEKKTEVKEQIKTKASTEPTKTLENQTKSFEKQNEVSTEDYNQQVANYTLNILENFKEIQPFKKEEKDQRWWKITPNKSKDQRGFLPYHNYILNQPCQKQVQSYNNYLFGVAENKGEITHYIYGIPGRYRKSEHPYEGKTGFITWLEDKEKVGNGYWLSYIDINTGNVVRPL